jgi:hypothetical protein
LEKRGKMGMNRKGRDGRDREGNGGTGMRLKAVDWG